MATATNVLRVPQPTVVQVSSRATAMKGGLESFRTLPRVALNALSTRSRNTKAAWNALVALPTATRKMQKHRLS